MGTRAQSMEIAFFGGSFTAVDRAYMLSLLEATKPFINNFYGIRISTRPDYIDNEVLELLKSYHVTSIELGAQSMDNSVLELNERGHSAQDVIDASNLIQQQGFSLGLQMMTGLYGSDFEKDIDTAEQFINLKPDTVRIYPTVIIKDTRLAEYFCSGNYIPYTLDGAVSLCAKLILMFTKADIPIIRLGLHYSDSLKNNSYGDNYHPAFKELCESKIFFDSFLEQAQGKSVKQVTINPKSLSKFVGQKKSNLQKLANLGYEVEMNFDSSLGKYDLIIN